MINVCVLPQMILPICTEICAAIVTLIEIYVNPCNVFHTEQKKVRFTLTQTIQWCGSNVVYHVLEELKIL